eukprot:gene3366-4170_t
MTGLAMACGVTVIATCTEIPPPPIGFEDVCNYLLTLPSLDIAQMGRYVQNLNLEYSGKVLSAEDEGLLATFKFCLGFILTAVLRTMSAIHGRAADGDEEDVFLKQFNKAGKDMSVQDSIAARLQLCAIRVPDDYPPKFSKVAVELLLGMQRRGVSAMNTHHREVGDLIVANGLLTSSLGALLAVTDTNHPVYAQGKRLLYSVLTSSKPYSTEYFTMSPLEAAYCWALSCRSSKYKELSFHVDGPVFEMEIDRILPQHYFFDSLETNVLYHTEKLKGESELCPPASDLLFLTKDGQLVLMDVTGGRGED